MRKEFVFEQLTGKDPVLYVKSKGVKVYGWGLWIRPIQEWFHLCEECSKQISVSLEETKAFLLNKETITPLLESREDRSVFIIPVIPLDVKGRYISFCESCSKQLFEVLRASHKWILGNKDYSPPVELQYKEESIDDDAWVELERRPATEFEKIHLKDEWYEE